MGENREQFIRRSTTKYIENKKLKTDHNVKENVIPLFIDMTTRGGGSWNGRIVVFILIGSSFFVGLGTFIINSRSSSLARSQKCLRGSKNVDIDNIRSKNVFKTNYNVRDCKLDFNDGAFKLIAILSRMYFLFGFGVGG